MTGEGRVVGVDFAPAMIDLARQHAQRRGVADRCDFRVGSFLSFPRAREWRAPLRRLRFWLAGCPLFLYSEARVRETLKAAGVPSYNWIDLDRDYVVIATLNPALPSPPKPL